MMIVNVIKTKGKNLVRDKTNRPIKRFVIH
jgi:hypothetical protein